MQNNINLKKYLKYLSLPDVMINNSSEQILEKLMRFEGKSEKNGNPQLLKELNFKIAKKEFELKTQKYLQTLGNLKYQVLDKGRDDSFDILAKQTSELIQGGEVDVIVNPVFKYQNAYTQLGAINLKDKELIVLTTKTKPNYVDHLSAHWNLSIFDKALNEIGNLDTSEFKYKVGVVELDDSKLGVKFHFTEHGFSGKDSPKKAVAKMKKELSPEELEEYEKSLKFYGHRSVEDFRTGGDNEFTKFSTILESHQLNYPNYSNVLTYQLEPLDYVIKNINNIKELNDYQIDEILGEFVHYEKDYLTDDEKFSEVFRNLVPELVGYSKTKVPNDIIWNVLMGTLDVNSVLENLKTTFDVNQEKLNDWLEQVINKKLVFYDFESFTNGLLKIDNVGPHNHVPFMFAVKDVSYFDGFQFKNEVGKSEVFTYDPLTIGKKEFKAIVDKLDSYSHSGLTHYVAYNASFENGVLNNIIKFLEDDPEVEIYAAKVAKIIENTIDPMKLFGSLSKMPDLAVTLPELKGYYGLKHLMRILAKPGEFINVDNQVLNGNEATVIGNARYYEIFDKEDFDKIKKDLEIYNLSDIEFLHFLVEWLIQQTKK